MQRFWSTDRRFSGLGPPGGCPTAEFFTVPVQAKVIAKEPRGSTPPRLTLTERVTQFPGQNRSLAAHGQRLTIAPPRADTWALPCPPKRAFPRQSSLPQWGPKLAGRAQEIATYCQ